VTLPSGWTATSATARRAFFSLSRASATRARAYLFPLFVADRSENVEVPAVPFFPFFLFPPGSIRSAGKKR